jgi:hypothetical protein
MPSRFWFAFAVPLWLFAQEPQSAPLLSGVLLERDTQTASGEFSVRAADNQVFRYRYDAKTYVERDSGSIDVPRLRPGDKVEVLSDRIPGIALRYALTVHVLPPPEPARATGRRRARANSGSDDRWIPTGDVSCSGVVFRVYSGRMSLRTRTGEQTILLRPDTRYLADGNLVDASALKPNMRVFVRAGRSLYDEVEAYQIVWGTILQPR